MSSIPPTTNSSFHPSIPRPLPPIVQTLLALQTAWYAVATAIPRNMEEVKTTTADLLNFLNDPKNQSALLENAAGVPCPFGKGFKETFDQTLNASISELSDWQNAGYPAQDVYGLAEFTSDVIEWAGLGPNPSA